MNDISDFDAALDNCIQDAIQRVTAESGKTDVFETNALAVRALGRTVAAIISSDPRFVIDQTAILKFVSGFGQDLHRQILRMMDSNNQNHQAKSIN